MVSPWSAVIAVAAFAVGAPIIRWMLGRLTQRVPPAAGSSEYEDVSGQVLGQIDAYRGHSGDHEPWDGVTRLETGHTDTE